MKVFQKLPFCNGGQSKVGCKGHYRIRIRKGSPNVLLWGWTIEPDHGGQGGWPAERRRGEVRGVQDLENADSGEANISQGRTAEDGVVAKVWGSESWAGEGCEWVQNRACPRV